MGIGNGIKRAAQWVKKDLAAERDAYKTIMGAPGGRAMKALDGLAVGTHAVNYIPNKITDAGIWAATKTVKKDPEGAHFLNGYTGLKESNFGKVAAWGAAAGYTGYSVASHQINAGQGPNVSYVGQAPIMGYDAVGEGNSKSKAPNLGANGSLVFGLNSMRRG